MGVYGKPSVEEAPAATKEPEKKQPTPAEVQPGAEQVGISSDYCNVIKRGVVPSVGWRGRGVETIS